MTTPWTDPTRSPHERARALLADLSLEEKVGQLGSYWLRPQDLGDTGFAPMQSSFDSDRDTFEAASAHGLGHITRAFGSRPMEPQSGVDHLRALQEHVIAHSPHGIPAIAHEECLTGFMAHGATTYPAAIAWGASFSPDLIEAMARQIGADMHAVGVHMGLSPVLDVVRDYRWGRIEETMGEDPYLIGMLATAYVRGLQDSGVVATLKHFAGHAASRAGRNHAPVSIGPRELHDVDLVPFEMAVRLGRAGAVMNSYADLDGVPPAADRWLLTELLRDDWGFDGTVVSDYFAVNFLQTMHGVASSPAEAAATALHAGMDVELPDTNCFATLAETIAEGHLPVETLDTAVERVLRQKIELGLLDPRSDASRDGQAIDLDPPENRALARRIAEESIVLVRNQGILPLSKGASIALVGPCAVDPRTHLGCYSFTNHVTARFGGEGTAVDVPTIASSLADRWGADALEVVRGVDILDPDTSGIEGAVAAARRADVALVAVGDRAGLFGTGTSGEGCDVIDLSLPGRQGDLLEAVLETGTPVVLLLVSGRPYAVGRYAERCAGVIQAFMPGEEGGPALAGILTGDVNPSGHLPVGLPSDVGGQPGTYLAPRLAWESEDISNIDPRPLYPFGHGLSYASFDLTDLSLDHARIAPDGTAEAEVTVTNTSTIAGAQVVQLYLSDASASVVRPLKRLVGFSKVHLEAGASTRLRFHLDAERTSFTGRDLRRVVEPGEFILRVGFSSEDTPVSARFHITGQTRTIDTAARSLVTPTTICPSPATAAR